MSGHKKTATAKLLAADAKVKPENGKKNALAAQVDKPDNLPVVAAPAVNAPLGLAGLLKAAQNLRTAKMLGAEAHELSKEIVEIRNLLSVAGVELTNARLKKEQAEAALVAATRAAKKALYETPFPGDTSTWGQVEDALKGGAFEGEFKVEFGKALEASLVGNMEYLVVAQGVKDTTEAWEIQKDTYAEYLKEKGEKRVAMEQKWEESNKALAQVPGAMLHRPKMAGNN